MGIVNCTVQQVSICLLTETVQIHKLLEGFSSFQLPIFQPSDIEKWTEREIQISICGSWTSLFVANIAAHTFSEQQSGILRTRGNADSLGLSLSICDLADKDGIFWVTDVPLLVHVGGSDGKHGAIIIESK